jgi:hypothetical protein
MKIGRREHGSRGTAKEVLPDQGEWATVDMSATIATWFLDCPGQSPAWRHYLLSVVHLRPIEGQSHEPVFQFPGATHEVMVVALDPDRKPSPADSETWFHLTPVNVAQQLVLEDDEQAKELLHLAARAVVSGILPAEPALAGAKEPWQTTLVNTAAHMRGLEHPGGASS